MSELTLKERYQDVLERMNNACTKAGRNRGDVKLLAVSKFQPVRAIESVAALGQRHFGENYIQEGLEKQERLAAEVEVKAGWDMIGHVQTRKAVLAAGNFNLIHTLDSIKLARALEKRLLELNGRQPVLMEVNIGAEPQKSGVAVEDVEKLAIAVMEHAPHLDLQGLMCMPPFAAAGELARPYFAKLRGLRDGLEARLGRKLPVLSMGMSGDFDIAIEEGATIVRVGTAIFGPRPASR